MTDNPYVWRDPFAEIEQMEDDCRYAIEREREYCHETLRRSYSAMSHENEVYRARFEGMMKKASDVIINNTPPAPMFFGVPPK